MIDPAGRVVRSLAGRDKGRSCVVLGICDEAHVYIVDGRTHKLCKPKKKKLKHLSFENKLVDLQKMPTAKSGAADAFIRNELVAYDHSIEEPLKEG